MKNETYTLLDLAEKFGKDKQFIRRRIMRLSIRAINKDTREYSNEPLEYDYSAYLELSKELNLSKNIINHVNETRNDTQSNTHEIPDKTQEENKNMAEDKVIEVLERELKHSKAKLQKSEEEKETLMRLLDQQQKLSLQSNQKIEMLEIKLKNTSEYLIEEKQEVDSNQKGNEETRKWWQFWKKF